MVLFLQIVREQCWLNEILSGCDWTFEGLKTANDEVIQESEATEEELQAVLNGNSSPRYS